MNFFYQIITSYLHNRYTFSIIVIIIAYDLITIVIINEILNDSTMSELIIGINISAICIIGNLL